MCHLTVETLRNDRNMQKIGYVFIIILLGYVVYCEFFRTYTPPDGYIIVSEQDMNAFDSIANLPPDTLHTVVYIHPPPDTIYLPGAIPQPEAVGDVNYYRDIRLTTHMRLLINDSIRGELLHRTIGYELFVPEKIIDYRHIYTKVPVPVRIYVPCEKKMSYYVSGGLGTGYSIEGGMIKSDRWMFGLQGGVFADNTFAQVKFGIVF